MNFNIFCLLVLTLLASSGAKAETKIIDVVVEPVSFDYAGAKLCYSTITQALGYFVVLNKPESVTPEPETYMTSLKEARIAFGRILVWEGWKSGKSRTDVEADVTREKDRVIASLKSNKRNQDYMDALAQLNLQAKVCLALI